MIYLYDTTLRDGSQREGVSLSVKDKLKIARRLDEMGFHYIEGGWPGSNPKDVEFFEQARSLSLQNATLSAFGSTRRANTRPEEDANLQALLAAETPAVALVGKSWDLHVSHVLKTTLDENLRMIGESVAFLKAQGREVIYDAEHFFDGYKADPDYALQTLRAAQEAGADCLVLCDTNGGCMPWGIEETAKLVRERFPNTPLGVHAHDDSGCAVANTLAAVRAGCVQVQGTINGYGERVGNADFCSLIPNLQLKMGLECLSGDKLARLTELSRFVSETANLGAETHRPYVGISAFAHKGGIHVSAIMKVVDSYQHIDPALVGNEKRVLISELSGRSNVVYKAQEFGLDPDKKEVKEALARIKELENQGFYFEGAEGSVELLLRRAQPGYVPPFELIDLLVIVEQRQGRGLISEATVKVRIGDEVVHTAAEGNGPVNALDKAMRKALLPHYPQLADVQLTDYKVRIIDSDSATAATTRVMIDTSNGHRDWSTVGSSTNIIDASWQALADSLEYGIANGGDNH
jgi:2-isopropylmalate synthase